MPNRLSPYEQIDGLAFQPESTAIRRLWLAPERWWVRVEAWRHGEFWIGRLVFVLDGMPPQFAARRGPPALLGRTREEVVSAAHEVSEARLREVLHSLA